MQAAENYVNERLDHLGIVAGVCQEIGLASWLDEQDPTNRQQVSVGTATTAMILNGLGFSNRQLYLVPQYFANKPVEHLLGKGITADMLNDDCLGRTLDWLYAHDPTKLFAGIARRARQIFGVSTAQVHVDTTSFSVSGEYGAKPVQATEREGVAAEIEADAALIAITYGYSRDHREDLKQWMLALATTHDGDIPVLATWYIYSKKSEICTKTINLLSCIAATKGICIQKMEYGKAPAQGTCRQRGNLFSLSVERKQGRKYQNAPFA
ncbi:MAG TPA: IS1634 family transposase [Ktedonobacteraceae bacterium]|nr:IS1634 family transposase [Ktedonobacteraceae bacterium]